MIVFNPQMLRSCFCKPQLVHFHLSSMVSNTFNHHQSLYHAAAGFLLLSGSGLWASPLLIPLGFRPCSLCYFPHCPPYFRHLSSCCVSVSSVCIRSRPRARSGSKPSLNRLEGCGCRTAGEPAAPQLWGYNASQNSHWKLSVRRQPEASEGERIRPPRSCELTRWGSDPVRWSWLDLLTAWPPCCATDQRPFRQRGSIMLHLWNVEVMAHYGAVGKRLSWFGYWKGSN